MNGRKLQLILDMVNHWHIQFTDNLTTYQKKAPFQTSFNEQVTEVIDNEMEKLLKQDVIKEVKDKTHIFVTTIFIRSKKDGEFRMILNLKKLNQYIPYKHFKMDTFESALFLIKKNSCMASIGLL